MQNEIKRRHENPLKITLDHLRSPSCDSPTLSLLRPAGHLRICRGGNGMCIRSPLATQYYAKNSTTLAAAAAASHEMCSGTGFPFRNLGCIEVARSKSRFPNILFTVNPVNLFQSTLVVVAAVCVCCCSTTN